MIADVEEETQSRIQQAVDHAREDLLTVYTGRAHPVIFNRLDADYYEAPTPLQRLVTLDLPDPRTMLVTPFDRSTIVAIEKIIRETDLGVNSSNDGSSIQVVMPQFTEERHKEYIKLTRVRAEDARIAARSIRCHSTDALKKLEKKSEISEGGLVRTEEAMDITTRRYVEVIDELPENKGARLSEV